MHGRWMLPLGVPWRIFWESYSALLGHIRRMQIKQRFWWYGTKSIWDSIKSTFGASPPHLSGRTGRDEEGTCIGKQLTKSNKGRKSSVESLSTPSSRPGRDASGGKKPRLWMLLFSLSQIGASSSRSTF